jgi:glycosyltransferase involved in cell wall biosynthesis
MKKRKKILIIGQTPPPYGGQAIMIEHLVKAKFKNIDIYHVRMNFSRGMKDTGKFQIRKIFHLFQIILQIYYYRLFKGVDILYYPPSGPTSAAYRDMAILFFTRFLFKKTIFHFHASGLSQHLENKNRLFQFVFKKSFMRPDVAIRLSESCPKEDIALRAKKCIIVPYGLPDMADTPNSMEDKEQLALLFVGILGDSKGEMDLLRAVAILKQQQIEVKAKIAGEFKRQEYKEIFLSFIADNHLYDNVEYLGVITGDTKIFYYRNSDVFCFPSYFHSESFPLVLIEAMSFGLPIITTGWRGIPDMVENGYNGFLIDIKSPEQLATKIVTLKNDFVLRKQMSQNGRKVFEERYSLSRHLSQMETIFENI